MAITTPIVFINRLEFCPNDGHYIGYLMLGFQYQQRLLAVQTLGQASLLVL